MRLWKNSRDTNDENSSGKVKWQSLTREEQLPEIINASFEKPQFIFKHSTRCGISGMVKNQFSKAFQYSESEVQLYCLDLLTYRQISDEIASALQVWHESPQLIVLKDGKVIKHASHGSILDLNMDI